MLGQQLAVGPSSITTGCGGLLAASSLPWSLLGRRRRWWRRRRGVLWVSAAVNQNQNHYAVLGLPSSASSSDIKKAYRLLARKWHPDVSKDSQAGEMFKSIHLAYQVLSDEATRVQYDQVLKSYEYNTERIRRDIYYNPEFDDDIRIHRWSEVRQKTGRERKYKRYNDGGENFSYYTESDDEPPEDDTPVEDRGSFIEVLQSAFLSLFLMHTVGSQLCLTFNSLMALFDRKLDGGYKLGYLVAWVMGGKAGVLLSMCLSFVSWACGKNSSSMVTLVVVAMWVGSNILSYAPLPQGALLALLYMSLKLQVDVN